MSDRVSKARRAAAPEVSVAAATALVERAYAAFERADYDEVARLTHPDFEWSFLDRSFAPAHRGRCRGPSQLTKFMARQADGGTRSVLEEVVGYGDRVMVVSRVEQQGETPQIVGRGYHVVTVGEGLIRSLRACRTLEEATLYASSGETG
jgi:ketosteroid isomerase-like protein